MGAVLFIVTVQVLLPPKTRLDGLHSREATASAGDKVREAVCELLPSVAVTTAVWAPGTAPAVALKVAVVAAAATLTEPGTVSSALLEPRATAVLAGAG